jgi:hypothetical protein
MSEPRRPIRIANCSGFFGDRLSAAAEMVRGGPIDVLTGDWLAELTMLILARQRMKHGAGSGYARTFLTQMKDVLAECLERDIKVVTNAGGLDPQGLADALREFADQAGLNVRIAVVTGDDLAPRIAELIDGGHPFENLDTGEAFADLGLPALAANAYLGGAPITAALAAGADVVVCGRVTDAALTIGPAAWWHDWDYATDLDPLAGALAAGHVIECGAQAAGGNYSFFTDIPDMTDLGFPIAEVSASGDSVITKHPGTGGLVSIGTVTSQLLYEVGPARYPNPDVVADFGSLRLHQVGRDRVRISGTKGYPPPDTLKVSLNYLGGFRNCISLVLTGLQVDEKADLVLRTVCGLTLAQVRATPTAELADRSTLDVRELTVELVGGDHLDPSSIGDAQSHLIITVKDGNPDKVGKAFTAPAVESALASYPGMFPTAPPGPASPFGVFWPTTIPRELVTVAVTIDSEPVSDLPASATLPPGAVHDVDDSGFGFWSPPAPASDLVWQERYRRSPSQPVPLGRVAGARSGDKGGTANVGLWIPDPVEAEAIALAAGEVDTLIVPEVRSAQDVVRLWEQESALPTDAAASAAADEAYQWLDLFTTAPGAVAFLIPEAADLEYRVVLFPHLRAVNICVKGLLGRGVSENSSLDPQAKGLGEYVRARVVDVPTGLLDGGADG